MSPRLASHDAWWWSAPPRVTSRRDEHGAARVAGAIDHSSAT